jgi:hypothetical protein
VVGHVRQPRGRPARVGRTVPGRAGHPGRLPARPRPDLAFNGAVADPALVTQAWANWRAEVEFAERFAESAPDLGLSRPHDGGTGNPSPVSLREVLVHMIEEYARHNGHADLLRERIDGRIGQ